MRADQKSLKFNDANLVVCEREDVLHHLDHHSGGGEDVCNVNQVHGVAVLSKQCWDVYNCQGWVVQT